MTDQHEEVAKDVADDDLESFLRRRQTSKAPGDRVREELEQLIEAVRNEPNAPSTKQLARQWAMARGKKRKGETNVYLTADQNKTLARLVSAERKTKRAVLSDAMDLLDIVTGDQCSSDVSYIVREWGAVDTLGAVSLAIRAFAKFSREGTIRTIDLST